jgi:multimeric flavodoxin WrbA
MKAIIFDGARNNDDTIGIISQVVVEQLSSASWNVETIVLRHKRIAGCTGCFGCWIQTPGICIINDDGREIAKQAAQADLLIFLTPVTFGGYSSELKKAVDRTLPVLLPYFTLVNGEVHHRMRYKRRQRLAVIGVQTSPDLESAHIFETLVERNAVNIQSPAHGSAVIIQASGAQEIGERTSLLLKNVGAVA